MIHAVDVQEIERLPDIAGRAFLAGMGDELQPFRARRREDHREFFRRMADFGGIEPDRFDPVQPGLGLCQRLERCFFREVPQEGEDELDGHAMLDPRVLHGREQPFDHHRERDAPVGMRLRIEHDLGMDDAIGRRAVEIGHGKIVKILPRLEDARAGIIDVEKVLQVGEGIGGAHILHRREGNRDSVAPRELEHLLGLQAAFDMEMELGLGQAGDEGVEIGHRRSLGRESRTGNCIEGDGRVAEKRRSAPGLSFWAALC